MKHPADHIKHLINSEHSMQDDEFLEHYLQNKSSLSRQYREIDTPMPSETLDKAILSEAQKQTHKTLWWRKPSSWAASIAIVSLAGLLTHNVWLSEQQSLPQPTISGSQPALTSEPNAPEDSDALSIKEKMAISSIPAKKMLQTNKAKDTRQLRYQAAPAPIISPRATPLQWQPIESRLKNEPIHSMETITGLAADKAPAMLEEKKQLQHSVYRDTHIEVEGKAMDETDHTSLNEHEPQQWLQTIKQYLQKGQVEQAQQLLQQLKKKYPEYPVDPVIIQQLSP